MLTRSSNSVQGTTLELEGSLVHSSSPSVSVKWRTALRGVGTVLGAAYLAVGCSAGGGENQGETVEVPSTTDIDNDGVVDELGKSIDANGDGVADLWDHNADGMTDGIGVDTNADGVPDAIGFDTNNDGIIDALDTDLDGKPDVFATDEVPAGDGDGDGGDGDIVIEDGDGDGDSSVGNGNNCNEFEMEFVPKTPTVYVLVDASSSMTELGFWEPMKTGVLDVVEQLSADVRFGFGSYTGTQTMCTGLTNATPALAVNNYTAIATAYNAIPAPPVSMDPSIKQETPTPYAIQEATEILLADDSPGSRYILLVSDGEPDFCNDTTANCAVDGTVAAIQNAHAQGVTTLVFAINSSAIANPQYFDYFAQAGVGQQPSWPIGLDVTPYSGVVESQCKSSPVAADWNALRTANANGPDATLCPPSGAGDANCFLPAGDYSAAGGEAQAILNSDPAALASQILDSVSGLKSCAIDLNFEIVNASKGSVFVNDEQTPIPADQWEVAPESTSTLNLLGAACQLWQQPDVTYFGAGFPCDAIVVR